MPSIGQHVFKAIGLIAIFSAILGVAASLLAYLSLRFVRSRKIPVGVGASWFEICSRAFNELARRKRLAVIIVGLACLGFRAALLPVMKVPEPSAHDEFSYLLAGDTFAHGRLTNPTPPMWMHFESMHINVRPTYMSMYPPGQGFVLAFGELLGHPWIGIWLVAGLGCAVIVWALQAWLPPRWALLGGLLATLQFGALCYWANTYYCTWLPAIGGALVLGALGRLRHRLRASQSVILGVGVSVLAVTRPYEGLVFCISVAAVLFYWIIRPKRGTLPQTISRMVLPVGLVMVLLGLFLGYYNFRVSRDPLIMPYKLNQQNYAVVPLFIWQHLRSDIPVYRNAEMRNYYLGWEVSEYRNTVASGLARMTWIKFERYWWFYIGPILTVPLFALPWALRDRRIRILLIVTAVTLIGLEVEVWSHPHYAAPLTCAFLAIVLQCMRHLQFWRWHNWRVGRAIVWTVVLACFVVDAAWVSAMLVHVNEVRLYMAGSQDRPKIARQLGQISGKHLVIVHYGPSHPVFREWVYNSADIEKAGVVWARDLGQECDAELIARFSNRKIWIVDPDSNPIQLQTYSPSVSTGENRCMADSGQ